MLIQPYCISLLDNGQDIILQVIRCSEFLLSHSKRVEPNSETSQLSKKLVMHSAKAIDIFCQNSLESLILISLLIPLDLPSQNYEHLNAISSESEPRVETIATCISN